MKKILIYILAYIGIEFLTYKAMIYILDNCITTIR